MIESICFSFVNIERNHFWQTFPWSFHCKPLAIELLVLQFLAHFNKSQCSTLVWPIETEIPKAPLCSSRNKQGWNISYGRLWHFLFSFQCKLKTTAVKKKKKEKKKKKSGSLLQLKGNPAIKFTKYLAEEHAECFFSYWSHKSFLNSISGITVKQTQKVYITPSQSK